MWGPGHSLPTSVEGSNAFSRSVTISSTQPLSPSTPTCQPSLSLPHAHSLLIHRNYPFMLMLAYHQRIRYERLFTARLNSHLTLAHHTALATTVLHELTITLSQPKPKSEHRRAMSSTRFRAKASPCFGYAPLKDTQGRRRGMMVFCFPLKDSNKASSALSHRQPKLILTYSPYSLVRASCLGADYLLASYALTCISAVRPSL